MSIAPLGAHPELGAGVEGRIWGWVEGLGMLRASPGRTGDAETCPSPAATGSSVPQSVAGHAGLATSASFK